ncbi:MAG: dipeptide/oligopeptide/nickel ABC transporter permease/ATP-binding protein [Propionibacteriaceae bacterium]|jgi:peptide/nickel transport system permease protein|nr:dipeptide/oligopeptide/nickel ABC transporter permease/ATP-binding protein [Propionibacteriaceae bacterium]
MTHELEAPGEQVVIARKSVWRRLLHNPLSAAAIVYLAIVVLVAVFQSWIAPFPPERVVPTLTNVSPFGSEYFLGGDRAGRDILSRIIAGTRGGVLSGIIMASVALSIGIVFGLIAGYFGKVFDNVANWVFSVLLAAPGIIILLALYTLVDVSMPVAMAVLGVIASPGVFYLVRTLTLNVRNELYVDAARVAGLSNVRIVGRHVLLAIKGPIIILAAFLCGGAISASAGLEFIGLGNPAEPSWGSILNDAFANLFIAPWQLIWPGLALGLTMAALVLLGNGLRDAIEGSFIKPSLRTWRAEVTGLAGAAAVVRTLGVRGASKAQAGSPETSHLLQIEWLQVGYPNGGKLNPVVDDVSLTVDKGEIVGLVGESGSGKTQTVFAAMGLLPDNAVVAAGSVRLDGAELLGLPDDEFAQVRGSRLAYIPQEPMSNLDPAFTVGSQLMEGIRAQSSTSRAEAKRLALAMLARVGIVDPARTFKSYPHEISGGMAQRVLIAGAVMGKPHLLFADEPTTALDVTVQAEVLDLLRDLQREYGMGLLLVTHNLGVVAAVCDRVVVMRLGQVVEQGTVREVFSHPRHEYTKMLLDSVLDHTEARSPLTEEGGPSDD